VFAIFLFVVSGFGFWFFKNGKPKTETLNGKVCLRLSLGMGKIVIVGLA
jgi:hypothetical protein